jgi:hypothetical protein
MLFQRLVGLKSVDTVVSMLYILPNTVVDAARDAIAF